MKVCTTTALKIYAKRVTQARKMCAIIWYGGQKDITRNRKKMIHNSMVNSYPANVENMVSS